MARRGDALYLRGKTWYLDAVINGVRCQKRLGKHISRTVARELAQVERAKVLRGEAGIGNKRKDLTFADARNKFEAWVKADKKPNTIRTYLSCLTELSKSFDGKRLSQITSWDLESYKKRRCDGTHLIARPSHISDSEWIRRCGVAERGAPVRANRELAVLKNIYNKCIAWRLYEGLNPMSGVKFRKEPKVKLRWLESGEEASLLKELSVQLKPLVVVGIHCGLRIKAEALTLRWESVDLKRGTLTVEAAYAKNDRARTVPLNSIALEVLKPLKKSTNNQEYVFVNKHGAPYRSISSVFRRACRRAGLADVTPHTLRHTFASRLVMAGVDLRTVQELGGWQTIGMIERYSHLSPQHKVKAVERLAQYPFGPRRADAMEQLN